MKTVVVIFLATLLYAENPQKSENLYSWQIQFSNLTNANFMKIRSRF